MKPGCVVVEAAQVFDAEAAAIVGVFARHKLRWKVLSNDPLWPDAAWPTARAIDRAVRDVDPTFLHFALHADETGLLLRWSAAASPESMEVVETLLWSEIQQMPCWRGRVVVTGACGLLGHADAFLHAGALAVVAPVQEIHWDRLCHVLRLFYSDVLGGASLEQALNRVRLHGGGYYDEFSAMGISGEKTWTSPALPPSGE